MKSTLFNKEFGQVDCFFDVDNDVVLYSLNDLFKLSCITERTVSSVFPSTELFSIEDSKYADMLDICKLLQECYYIEKTCRMRDLELMNCLFKEGETQFGTYLVGLANFLLNKGDFTEAIKMNENGHRHLGLRYSLYRGEMSRIFFQEKISESELSESEYKAAMFVLGNILLIDTFGISSLASIFNDDDDEMTPIEFGIEKTPSLLKGTSALRSEQRRLKDC